MKMNYRKFFLGFLIACLATVSASAQKTTPTPSPTPETVMEDDEPLKIEADLVNILFTAADKDRRFLTDLTKDDVRILEDGKPQQIFTFQRQANLPLSLAILIDTSVSQELTLPEEKAAAMAFLEDVVRSNQDEVAILSFTGETIIEQGLTNNFSRIRRSIERIELARPANYAGGGVTFGTTEKTSGDRKSAQSSAIWDAVFVTSDEVMRQSKNETRRAIILLTDGDDTGSSKHLKDTVDMALKVDAVVYVVGIGHPFMTRKYPNGVNENALRQIADRTGGRAYFPRDERDLQGAFDQIQNELRSQYLIAYEPTNPKKDGSYRKIEIQVANPALEKQKIRLTHRQGYFSESAPQK